MGKDHIGALVNTLVLAYTSTALPLLLLLHQSSDTMLFLMNTEVFATEIMRTIVGSIGLVLAVPITTILAVFVLKPNVSAKKHLHEDAQNTAPLPSDNV